MYNSASNIEFKSYKSCVCSRRRTAEFKSCSHCLASRFKCQIIIGGNQHCSKFPLNVAASFIQNNIAYVMCMLILYTIFCAVVNSIVSFLYIPENLLHVA